MLRGGACLVVHVRHLAACQRVDEMFVARNMAGVV